LLFIPCCFFSFPPHPQFIEVYHGLRCWHFAVWDFVDAFSSTLSPFILLTRVLLQQ
jgi:hypothetical protein